MNVGLYKAPVTAKRRQPARTPVVGGAGEGCIIVSTNDYIYYRYPACSPQVNIVMYKAPVTAKRRQPARTPVVGGAGEGCIIVSTNDYRYYRYPAC